MKNYALQVLIALSQLGNALLGGFADESMSARAWRTAQAGKFPGIATRPLIDAFFYAITLGKDREHCKDSYESEVQRKQFPEYYR
jgi:hypothetical protein